MNSLVKLTESRVKFAEMKLIAFEVFICILPKPKRRRAGLPQFEVDLAGGRSVSEKYC